MSRHLLDTLLQHAMLRPDVVALRAPGQPARTWLELARDVERTARAIKSLVGDRGDSPRIVYQCQNSIDDVIVSLACLAAGAIEMPIDARLPRQMNEQIVARCQGVCVVTADLVSFREDQAIDSALESLRRSAEQVDIRRPSLVLWTSGTSHQPRGVMLSQHHLTTNANAKCKAVPQTHDDVRLTLLSIAHAYARTCDMGTWLLSGCQWTLDLGGHGLDRIDARSLPTMINSVPVMARQILTRLEQHEPRLSKLAVVGCGGAALDTDSYERFRQTGVEVVQGYGCTETSPVICSSSPGDTYPGWVGPPIEDCEVRIVDRRLFVRGPLVMLGYLDDPEATDRKIDGEGWFDTGDLVEQHSNGQLRILGRADEVIVLENGFKIHPLAIEQAIVSEHGCEHVVLLAVDQQLLIAVQAGAATDDAIMATAQTMLPPNTPLRVVSLEPSLSYAQGELTAKNTPRRQLIRKRFEHPETTTSTAFPSPG